MKGFKSSEGSGLGFFLMGTTSFLGRPLFLFFRFVGGSFAAVDWLSLSSKGVITGAGFLSIGFLLTPATLKVLSKSVSFFMLCEMNSKIVLDILLARMEFWPILLNWEIPIGFGVLGCMPWRGDLYSILGAISFMKENMGLVVDLARSMKESSLELGSGRCTY